MNLLGILILNICVMDVVVSGFCNNSLRLTLKWYEGTHWYWYYTIDPVGYQFWNWFMIADMFLLWYLFRKCGLIKWIKDA